MRTAFGNGRALDIDVVGATSMDALAALAPLVAKLEMEYAEDNSKADFAGGDVIAKGTNKYQIHNYTLVTVFATGTYTFTFVETAPTVDDLA